MNRLYQYKGITVSNGIAIVWNIFSALIVFNLVRQSKGFFCINVNCIEQKEGDFSYLELAELDGS